MADDWIRWEDKKPEDGQSYLVVVGSENRAGYHRSGSPIVLAEYDGNYRDGRGMWYWEDGESGHYNDPCRTYCNAAGTLWMPIPAPPPGY